MQKIQDTIILNLQKQSETLVKNIYKDDTVVDKCHALSVVMEDMLNQMGFNARAVIGYACWRIHGEDDGAVISHHPSDHALPAKIFIKDNAIQVAQSCHSWLLINNAHILDITTKHLPQKLACMDALDGRCSQIDWAPDYLYVSQSKCLPRQNVINSFKSGVFYYEVNPELNYVLDATRAHVLNEREKLINSSFEGNNG